MAYKNPPRALLVQKTLHWRRLNPEKHAAYLKRKQEEGRALIHWIRDVPCLDCGDTGVPMEFDHVRGVKQRNVAMMWTYSLNTILEEAMKCDVVCHTCHMKRTAERRVA